MDSCILSRMVWPLCGMELTFAPHSPNSHSLFLLPYLGQDNSSLWLLFPHLKNEEFGLWVAFGLFHAEFHRAQRRVVAWSGGRGQLKGPPMSNQSSSGSHRTCVRCYVNKWLCSLKTKLKQPWHSSLRSFLAWSLGSDPGHATPVLFEF